MTDAQRNRLKNVILYILNSFSGGADYIKLYKIMYFANRCQLAMIGVPIVCDNFKAWKFGPVPAFTGSVIKCFENETPLSQDMKIFRNVLRVRRNKLVKGLATPDVEGLRPGRKPFIIQRPIATAARQYNRILWRLSKVPTLLFRNRYLLYIIRILIAIPSGQIPDCMMHGSK